MLLLVPNLDLSTFSDEQLIQELTRRLAGHGKNKSKAESSKDVSDAAAAKKNGALQQMARSLRAGVRRGQPVEILKFLISQGAAPQTMAHIAAHMKRLRYTATRYYDASNALVEVGFAQRTKIGYDRAWIATPEGRAFLESVKL